MLLSACLDGPIWPLIGPSGPLCFPHPEVVEVLEGLLEESDCVSVLQLLVVPCVVPYGVVRVVLVQEVLLLPEVLLELVEEEP